MEDKQNLPKKTEEKIEKEIELIVFLIKRGWEQMLNPDGICFDWRHKDQKNPLAIVSASEAKRIEEIKDKRKNKKGQVIKVDFKK